MTPLSELDLRFLGFSMEIECTFEGVTEKQTLVFIAMGVAEKAQWIADISQVRRGKERERA